MPDAKPSRPRFVLGMHGDCRHYGLVLPQQAFPLIDPISSKKHLIPERDQVLIFFVTGLVSNFPGR